MLVCGCGRWMHTEGVDESVSESGTDHWLVRSECCGCGWKVGLEIQAGDAHSFVDRLVWSDDARHVLGRMPPYLATVYKTDIEDYARSRQRKVVTWDLLNEARQGEAVAWEPEAAQRLQNVPAPVRSMAKVELERTAAEKGMSRVTIGLMEEVKARYFGFASGNEEVNR